MVSTWVHSSSMCGRELQTSFSSAGWVFIAIVTVSIVLVALIKNVLHRFADSQDVVDAVEQQVENVSEEPR